MTQHVLRSAKYGLMLLACSLLLSHATMAATVTATPKLDLQQFMGTWYVISQYPTKFQRKCVGNDTVLYALGDKTGTFQMGTFCTLQNGSPNNMNSSGRRDKFDDGRLQLSCFALFHQKYWILAAGPNYDWALIGAPNHKSLWILSRARTLAPAVLTQLQGTASAQGFDISRLITITQMP